MKLLSAPIFTPSRNANAELTLFFDEIYDLAICSQVVANMSSQDLYKEYEQALRSNSPCPMLENITVNGRVLGKFKYLKKM